MYYGGNMEILKVGSKSNPSKVAGAIANIFRENKSATIQTVGAASLNQAIMDLIFLQYLKDFIIE